MELGGKSLRIGIDIGSTTVKVVLLDDQDKTVFHTYERHMSKVREKTAEMLRLLRPRLSGQTVRVAITGSAGLGVAKAADLEFVQEVFATAGAVERFIPDTDVVVELGGEDAKIIFLTGRSGGTDERLLCRRHRRVLSTRWLLCWGYGGRTRPIEFRMREAICYRVPLRRVCQKRYSAFAQPRSP